MRLAQGQNVCEFDQGLRTFIAGPEHLAFASLLDLHQPLFIDGRQCYATNVSISMPAAGSIEVRIDVVRPTDFYPRGAFA